MVGRNMKPRAPRKVVILISGESELSAREFRKVIKELRKAEWVMQINELGTAINVESVDVIELYGPLRVEIINTERER